MLLRKWRMVNHRAPSIACEDRISERPSERVIFPSGEQKGMRCAPRHTFTATGRDAVTVQQTGKSETSFPEHQG